MMGGAQVTVLAIAPDESLLAVGPGKRRLSNFESHHPSEVKLWNIRGNEPSLQAVITLPGAAQALAISPDGKTIAVADDYDALKLHDTATGDERAALAPPSAFRGAAMTSALIFSPDGRTLASASAHWIWLWDVATGARKANFRAYEGNFTIISGPSLAFSPDGEAVAVGGLDRRITLRDTREGRVLATLEGHEDAILHVSFMGDGASLISADRGGKIHLWDLETGRMRATLTGHSGPIWSMKRSPDGRTLATQAKEIRLWDLQTESCRATLTSVAPTHHCFAISPDSSTLTTVGWEGGAELWDVETGRRLGAFEVDPSDARSATVFARFSERGTTLATTSPGGPVRIWTWKP